MIDGIRILGKCFTENTDLQFFREENQRVAIVYGRNGSGKSTISRGFFTLTRSASNVEALEEEDRQLQSNREILPKATLAAELLSTSSRIEGSSGRSSQEVVVYNEDFIDQKIRVKGDGIGTVVFFGDQTEIQDQIDDKRSLLNGLEAASIEAVQELQMSDTEKNNAENNLIQVLKNNWATRSRKILASTIATPSWSKTVAHLKRVEPAEGSLGELLIELDQKIEKHQSIAVAERIDASWNTASYAQLVDRVNPELLSAVLMVPTGEGLRAIISDSLERFENHVHDAKRVFSDPSVSHCPMCQRVITAEYRQELVDAIRNAVDDEAENYRNVLDGAKLAEFELGGSSIDIRLGKDLIANLLNSVKAYNSCVLDWNSKCEDKKSQLYTKVSWQSHDLIESARSLENSLKAIEEARVDWNSAVDNRERVQSQIILLNDQITRLEESASFDRVERANRLFEQSIHQETLAKSAESKVRKEVADLLAQSANVQIAANEINAKMQAIFAERNRLKLELQVGVGEFDESVYHVLNHGFPMRPEDLSIGERNILALTYFFTTVRKSLSDLGQSDSIIVVLDDPISSVDVDNRLGIHGFMETQLREMLKKSNNVRFVIMTHDLTAARDFAKSADAAMPSRSAESGGRKFVRVSYVLHRGTSTNGSNPLELKNLGKLNEYEALLAATYKYASSDSGTSEIEDLTVGNAMRRVLEAFSTFIYGAGILDPVLGESYAEATGGRDLSVDLKAGHRGFLHDTSHAEDGLTALRDYGGFAGLQREEQILHVRRVLAFMYTIQRTHMRRYLPQGAEENVVLWKRDLLSS